MVAGVDFLLHLKVSHPCSINRCKWNSMNSATMVKVMSAYSSGRFTSLPVSRRSPKLVVRANRRSNGQWRKKDAYEEVIYQLERMKEPGEVLDSIGEELSAEDLERVLNHFAEEGRDSWYALEVFEWMQKVNRVEDKTHKLMLEIMQNWAKRLVEQGEPVEQMKALLEDIHYVGLKPLSGIVFHIIFTYSRLGKETEALTFVKQVMSSKFYEDSDADPLSNYIGAKILKEEAHEALKLVFELRSSGFRLKGTSYRMAVMAAVREQKQLAQYLPSLKKYQAKGILSTDKNENSISTYQRFIHTQAEEIAGWAVEDESSQEVVPSIYERLLTMYCLAGKAPDAERNLWKLKLMGRAPIPSMFNSILGTYASNNQPADAYSLLEKMESVGEPATRLTFAVLVGGFIKGGNPTEAASAMLKMIERGFRPEGREMLATLRALREPEFVNDYLKLCKVLAEEELMEPYVLYFPVESLKLWIVKLL